MLQDSLTLNGNLGIIEEADPVLEGVESAHDDWYDDDYDDWYDCEMEDKSSALPPFLGRKTEEDHEDKWYDCKTWRLPRIFSPRASKDRGAPIGYPCVLMILSSFMLSMYSVGILLASKGLTWAAFQWEYFQITSKTVLEYFRGKWNGLWPPPRQIDKGKAKDMVKSCASRLALLALVIALQKAYSMPEISLHRGFKELRNIHRKRRGSDGLLMTAKLTDVEREKVIESIAALPGQLLEKGDVINTIVDTGASISCSSNKAAFVPGSLVPLEEPWKIEGIGGALEVTHFGILNLELIADDGTVISIQHKAGYMPHLPVNLISPQRLAEYRKETLQDEQFEYKLNWAGSKLCFPDGKVVTIRNDPNVRLPILPCFANALQTAKSLAMTCVTDEKNQNLTHLQKVLLQWHFKLGHVGFQTLQWIGRQGWLGKIGEKMGSTSVQCPKCASCQYGKQERTPKAGTSVTKTREGITKADKLEPGDLVFSDQYESRIGGKIFNRRGTAISRQDYCGGTLFCDGATGRIAARHQVSLSAPETTLSKQIFEKDAFSVGVTVKAYSTDNGVYTSAEFQMELAKENQQIKHSGVGGHHHNGVAENAIKNVVRTARTLMIHAALRWPEMTAKELWPLALDHAIWLHNHTPRSDSGFSPEELWCRSKSEHLDLQRTHVWGCPAYVLDPRSQDGKKIPKWDPRSRRGQFVGFSPLHSSHVGLIRHLKTNNISPQFHVVYDDYFETVHADENEVPPQWDEFLTLQSRPAEYDDVDYMPDLSDEWVDDATLQARRQRRMERKETAQRPGDHPPMSADNAEAENEFVPDIPPEPDPAPTPTPKALLREVRQLQEGADHWVETREQREDGLRRSSRQKQKERYQASNLGQLSPNVCSAIYSTIMDHTLTYGSRNPTTDHRYLYALLMDPEFGVMDNLFPDAISRCPALLKASKAKSDPDLPTMQEALSGPHRAEFLEAMQNEIQELEEHGTWDVIPRDQAPEGANILPSTWAFRVKRFPDGRFRKTKARFCARGDKQVEGVDYFDKYAPVVSWSTVRLLMVTAITQGWKSKQVDFSNAFVQADLYEDVYMSLPSGFVGPNGEDRKGVILKLKKSLYGLVQAPMYWFNHLKAKMENVGLRQSDLDQCVFYGRGIVALCYVDDCLFWGPDENEINQVIKELQADGTKLTQEEGSAYAFLGVDVEPLANGGFKMSQKGLTKKILATMGMTDCRSIPTPAADTPLGTDADGASMNEEWSYPQAVGMMLYLSSNSRPDIQYAVHQCARFTHCPKQSHAVAMKRICRYLQGTLDQGLEFKPTPQMELDLYVDADFAGLWNFESDQDPVSVKSRTGYTVTLGGCPVTWVSKLQTEIALSTLESEYIALSTAMRDLVPMRRFLQELGTNMKLAFAKPAIVHSTVFEDNNGALGLATSPKMTPRTKHIAVKYHWFKSQIGEDRGVRIKKVNSELQKADIFTKGLTRDKFESIRKLLMGW